MCPLRAEYIRHLGVRKIAQARLAAIIMRAAAPPPSLLLHCEKGGAELMLVQKSFTQMKGGDTNKKMLQGWMYRTGGVLHQ